MALSQWFHREMLVLISDCEHFLQRRTRLLLHQHMSAETRRGGWQLPDCGSAAGADNIYIKVAGRRAGGTRSRCRRHPAVWTSARANLVNCLCWKLEAASFCSLEEKKSQKAPRARHSSAGGTFDLDNWWVWKSSGCYNIFLTRKNEIAGIFS